MMLDRDEMRLWADHRRAVGAWFDGIAAQLRGASEAAVRHLYAAPWDTPAACRGALAPDRRDRRRV